MTRHNVPCQLITLFDLISFQAPKESLVCILDCMAQMLTIPEEVEAAFLERIIKAFTQVRHRPTTSRNHLTVKRGLVSVALSGLFFLAHQQEKSSEAGKSVYATMTEVTRLLLRNMRKTAEAKAEGDLAVPLLPTT